MPLLAYSFSDDAYAPRAAVDSLLELYANAARDHRHLTPADAGVDALGHFGFFREKTGGALWPELVSWLDRQARAVSAVA